MGKIAVILMDRFEDMDYIKPMEYLKGKGYELIHVGMKEGQTVKGRQREIQVKIDQAVTDVSAKTFDAMLIPRGYTLETLKEAKDVVELVKDFLESGKPVWRTSLEF
jgi:protease I